MISYRRSDLLDDYKPQHLSFVGFRVMVIDGGFPDNAIVKQQSADKLIFDDREIFLRHFRIVADTRGAEEPELYLCSTISFPHLYAWPVVDPNGDTMWGKIETFYEKGFVATASGAEFNLNAYYLMFDDLHNQIRVRHR